MPPAGSYMMFQLSSKYSNIDILRKHTQGITKQVRNPKAAAREFYRADGSRIDRYSATTCGRVDVILAAK